MNSGPVGSPKTERIAGSGGSLVRMERVYGIMKRNQSGYLSSLVSARGEKKRATHLPLLFSGGGGGGGGSGGS